MPHDQGDKRPTSPLPSAVKGDFFRIFSLFILTLFLIEFDTHLFMSGVRVSRFTMAVIDTFLLAAIIAPLGYFLIYKRYLATVGENLRKEEELRKFASTLEEKVMERTAILTTSQAEIRSMLESSADGIMRFDDKGGIHMANPAAHRLLGYQGVELIGRHISAIIPGDFVKLLVEGYVSSLWGWHQNGRLETVAAMAVTKDGKKIDVELSISECVISAKTQYVIVMRDVSERKKSEEALKKAKETAEEATRLKDKFVSLVAHDLKSPISTMTAFMQLLLEENAEKPLGQGGREILGRLIESGRQLSKSIDDLLGMSRLKSGQLKLKMTFFDAKNLVARVCADFSYSAGQKGITLVNKLPDGSRIYADRVLLYEALQNLITNAVKFCNNGDSVTISIGGEEGTSISVRDTGPGMSMNALERILKFEEKLSTTGTVGESGTGLGLPLVRDIMVMHGGGLEADCKVGGGCEFILKMPYVKPRVLIVDDDKNFRFMVRHHLKKYEIDVSEAEDGATAIDMMADGKNLPHLIISDVEMPKMSGLDFLSYLQKRRETASIPVIIISGKHGMEIRDTVYGLGAKDFLTKQIDVDDFIPRVRRHVG